MAFNFNSTITKIRKEDRKLLSARGASVPKKRRKKMSASARKKTAAAQRARWAKVRAAKKV
jgi:hypothetical protein